MALGGTVMVPTINIQEGEEEEENGWVAIASSELEQKIKLDADMEALVNMDFQPIADNERLLAIDSIALLGGNENLVQQILDAGVESSFTERDSSSLAFASLQLWGEKGKGSYPGLAPLLNLFKPLHRERLPRILASSLLYCGRHPDTAMVALPPTHPNTRLLLLNMNNFPGADPPIGLTPGGKSCSRLAVLYHWAPNGQQEQTHWTQEEEKIRQKIREEKRKIEIEEKIRKKRESESEMDQKQGLLGPVRRMNERRMSVSLYIERKMLDIVDVFAIFPCP